MAYGLKFLQDKGFFANELPLNIVLPSEQRIEFVYDPDYLIVYTEEELSRQIINNVVSELNQTYNFEMYWFYC
ncbi:MAG: hypothetical protein ACFE9R_08950, partial [Candidatus Hermodarchaeota archaeon]